MWRLALLISVLCICALATFAQVNPEANQPPQGSYTIKLSVDEVALTFHAADVHGLPVNDLKFGEVRVLDNGSPPRRVISFDNLVNLPIHAALLVDTSESMEQALPESKRIVGQFADRIFRQNTDQGMVMDFGYTSDFIQPWTTDHQSFSRSVQNIRLGRMNPRPGTAIFSTVLRACFYGFNKFDPSTTGNFLLLFSDGEDNSGQASLEEALRACQHTNTVIYAFRFPAPSDNSTGAKTLRKLADGTGGRVFPADDTPDAIWKDLEIIESEVRNQYRLVYNPAHFASNGGYHAIELQLPDRVDSVEVRSGYFAPIR
jgi:Ca-activated chloride channel family protein